MQFDDRVTIATPEGVDLELMLAGLGSRLFAGVIDTLLQWVVIGVFTIVASVVFFRHETNSALFVFAAFLLLQFVLLFGYGVLFETFAFGRTPGKRWTGLRVVTTGGAPIGFSAAAVRNLLRIVDFLPTAYLVGMVFVFVTRRNQRVGDLAAGTIVVRERGPRGRAIVDPGIDFRALPEGVETWDVTRVSATDVATIRRFLMRRDQLDRSARERLALELATRLRPVVVGPSDDLAAESLLEGVVRAKAPRL